ncbi:MAG: NPCBM/NEW2 domain-containing protein [Clostridium celatum]|nr:NPCBM/NEW2 domain-containing protein [Clostridium celatum]
MLKRKLSTLILAATITNLVATPANVFAETLANSGNVIQANNEKEETNNTKATVTKFSLYGNKLLESYNKAFKMDNTNIESISNNGDVYQSSTLDKAIDGNFQTHWETGKENTSKFTNEVIFNLKESTTLNRIVYAARPDADGKGFAEEFEVYASKDDSDNFQLITTGEYKKSTKDVIEIKFDATEFKRIKFVFKKANRDWASAAEFMFYKEDTTLDKVKSLFIDNTMSVVSQEFNTVDKINELEEEFISHPLYEDYRENFENARIILETKEIEATEAKVSKFEQYYSEKRDSYDAKFKMDNSNIASITSTGGNLRDNVGTKNIIDGDLNTYWETGKHTSDSFSNELIFTLNKTTELNRIAYRSAGNTVGFAESFEVWASNTSKGDTFQLVSSATATKTADMVEIKFNNTSFKRIKFVFKNAGTATASEMMFYKEDTIMDKMNNIFTNDSKNELSEEFNSIEELEAFALEASTHPLYSEIEEDINNARIILEGKKLGFTEAKVSNFKSFDDERLDEYNELFKVPLENVTSITTNGGKYDVNGIERAMDGNVNTNWHSKEKNTSSHTNEVIITLDKLTTINRIMYTNLVQRGFAQEFEIYGSRTSEGDTFEKISEGSTEIKAGKTLQMKFNPTEVRRVKFVYKKGYEDWALASEFGLYMQDELEDKMDILFVDEDMKEVSPQFATVQAIDNLIEETENHPFKDEYVEKLNIAKELIEFGKIQSGTANVSKFEPFYTDYINEYDDVYRVKNLSISNNGGQYNNNSAIKYAIDEDTNTHWETGNRNSDSFKNEVILTLEEAEIISRLTYKSRVGGKGFAEQFSIYVSPVAAGDNFQKVTEGNYTVTNDMLEIQFEATKAKRVKFVFDKAKEDWASISDIRLYKEDSVSNKMKSLFTNGLMDTVSEEFKSIEKLTELENEVNNHPLAAIYVEDIKIAKEILNGTLQTVKTVIAEQHGDRNAHANKNLKFGFGNNNQPTGIVARPGETITVYVDAEPGQPLPQLVFSQQEGSFASWGRTVSLNIGKNVITVPAVTQNDGWYNHSVTPGGPVYIVNPYTEEQQSKAPAIRFASGCEQFPMMDKNTNEQEFLELLKDYKARVDADKKANPNVMDRKMIDVVEVVSDHLVFTGTATGAYEAYINQEFGPMNTVNMYNDHMDMVFDYYGLDGSNENNDIKYTRENIRLAQPFGYMYAAGGHIGVQGDVMVSMLTNVGSWGVDHEMGHKLDIGVRTLGEVTNNMIPQNSSYYYNKPNKRIPFESHVFKNVISTDSNNHYDGGYFERLAVFWQLEMIYPGYWGKLNKLYRENNVVLDSGNAENDKLNQLAKYSGIALGLDLSEHFERHGFWVSDETKELLSQYQKPEIKTWYANYDYIEYKGEGFNGNSGLSVNVLKENENVKLTFRVNNEYKNDVLGYEIFKDGELIGFTSTNSFIDTNSNIGESVNYTVVPYDKKLNAAEEVVVNSLTPNLSLQQESISIKLREEFNPRDLVKALNYNGEDITSNVVVSGEVNVNEKGTYPVEYTITDNGVVVTKTVNVEVVSDYEYLSDIDWISATTQHGTPRRNSNIKGRVNGEIKTFDKGIGIHANGKITYDLSNLDYDNFEALVGVDMDIAPQTNSSIAFKVIADGEVLATTDVMKHADNMVAIKVPVKGVKELVIEINDANNIITSDHSVIVDPKLTTNNVKPSLTVGETEYIKLKSEYDLMSGVNANDQEDGDITNKVVVNSNGFTTNKTGEYKVSYTVTDKDENTVTVEKTIVVYSDSEYLSDVEWSSARTDYGSVRKDLASGGAKIKLSVNGEERVFDKGIGTHANSEIVYNLEGTNYEYFETYVGIDRNIPQQNYSSVIFKVYADGNEVYNSGIMKWADDAKLVRIPLEGVSELKLVADNSINGDTSDHANFGDAKFLVLNSAPKLNIPKSVSTKVGNPIALNEEYSATDAEDGDLTEKIEVTGEVNFSKAGSYELTYKVTDSDGNTTTKTRTVAVVDMNDYTYLTEYDWKSTNNSYTAPRKNIGIGGNTLRLTNEKGQEVSYEKGIGAHSTSTIVYDLSDKNYAYFSSYVGVDRQMYGTVGSVSFEVWVDGEKKFDSKLMNSRDSQKYVEVDINGAKELKLVVTDGGNGNGSDHGVWGDAKLHFANNEGIEINTAQLDELIANINSLNKESYTEESYNNLKVVLDEVNAELANGYTQEEVDNLFDKLNEAYGKLEEVVDLSQVIEIPDSYLKNAIKSALNISSDNITIGDMYELTELEAIGYGISNLEGLQYAKNLETLNLDYNEIKDLSKLKNLEKLSNLQAMYQYIVGGTLNKQDNRLTIEFDAIDKNGEKLNPTQIIVRNNKTLEDTTLNIEECIDENGVISFETTDFDAFMHTVYVGYEDTENNYIAQVMYMFDNR